MSKINEIKALLDQYDNEYYNYDSPSIEDAEYDVLKAEYLRLTGEEEYSYVPGNALFSKFKHTQPIKSLNKVNISQTDELRKHIERLWPVVIQPKLDGLTLVSYPDGRVVTRGDGMVGEDVTANASPFVKLSAFCVRGEAIMTIPDFDRVNREREAAGLKLFKNPRNAAAGMLRNKDRSKVQGLMFMAYNIIDKPLADESTQLTHLRLDDYDVIDSYSPDSIEEAMEFIQSFDRSLLDYEIDGLVIKSDTKNSLEVFGETGHHPNNAIAVKFVSQGEWTTLTDVVWTVGKEKIVPNARFEPVDIMGSTIDRATLHNIAYIDALDLHIGDRIKVIKANDVIPAVVERAAGEKSVAIQEPTTCPACGSQLEKVVDQLFCRNDDCSGKLVRKIASLAGRDALDIRGLSEATIDKMYDAGLLEELTDIFEVTLDQIKELPGFAETSAKNVYEAIQKSRKAELNKMIYAAGIPLIGRKVSFDISCHYGSFTAMKEAYINKNKMEIDLREIEDIGYETAAAFVNGFPVIKRLAQYVETTFAAPVKKNPSTTLSFVVTGTLSRPRKDIEAEIKAAGHKLSGSVSSKTDYVVTNDTESTSSKFVKATELGIPIINEDALEVLLNEN
jgi:DNA ligase (NAD+)